MPRGSRASSTDRAQRFRTTREAHADETAEDYVEAIGDIIAKRGSCRVRDLAEMMGVSHVTVSRIIARLADPKLALVRTEPYRPIELTPKGQRLARAARERHEQVVAFLRAIGVSPKQAEIDAEGIEHHVSKETLRAMDRLTRERREP